MRFESNDFYYIFVCFLVGTFAAPGTSSHRSRTEDFCFATGAATLHSAGNRYHYNGRENLERPDRDDRDTMIWGHMGSVCA